MKRGRNVASFLCFKKKQLLKAWRVLLLVVEAAFPAEWGLCSYVEQLPPCQGEAVSGSRVVFGLRPLEMGQVCLGAPTSAYFLYPYIRFSRRRQMPAYFIFNKREERDMKKKHVGGRKQDKRHRKARKWMAGPNFSAQHLLHNRRTIEELIRIPRLQASETVLEIGAGKGAITFALAGKVAKVIGVEQDAGFAAYLRERAAAYAGVVVVHGDFRKLRLPPGPFCVVANIPFSITTAILERLLGTAGAGFQRGAFIMEKGAAIRFASAKPTEPRLIAWRMNYHIEIRQTVPRTHFAPPPRVDGAMVSVARREQPLLPVGQYSRFCAFAGYMLRHANGPLHVPLGAVFTAAQMKKALKEAGVDRAQLVSELDVRQWSMLFHAMLGHVDRRRWPK